MGIITNPFRIIRVAQLAEFKRLLQNIFLNSSKATTEDGDDTITTYTIS